MSKFDRSIPVHSALFRVIDGMIFNSGKTSFRINKVLEDTNDLNKDINNESRIKDKLFNEILRKYNARVDKYDMNFDMISTSHKENFSVLRYKLSNNDNSSAYYTVFPKTFICKKCGHIHNVSYEDWDKFDPRKCLMEDCDGYYEQSLNLLFCPQCGKIESFNYYCKEHGPDYWKIDRPDLSQPRTWEIYCSKCENPNHLDLLGLYCNHNVYGNKISDGKATKYSLLTAVDGAVSSPVVSTLVDIPKSDFDSPYLDYILLGLYFDKFHDILDEIKVENHYDYENIILKLKKYTLLWDNEDLRDVFEKEAILISDKLKDRIDEIMFEFSHMAFSNITDYLILSGMFSKKLINSTSFDEFIEISGKNHLKEKYLKLKQEFKLENINYISNINLVAAAIGTNLGINKFEDNFVPHFQPIWEKYKDAYSSNVGKFRAYAYPFETEGILFSLDPIEVVNWVIDNKKDSSKLPNNHISSKEQALEILFNLEEEDDEYEYVKTLLHTLSHVLIRRSSLFTGLDTDSCGELIFVNSSSFLIYSTSNINIGGFYYVFENSLIDWFKNIKIEIDECVLDPNCIHENGACFSCLYLPEFVCSDFNQFLDRDVFIGKHRFEKGFWD